MTKRTGILCLFCLMLLFLILNRAAYKSYFQDDEFDNVSWTSQARPSTFLEGVLTPRFLSNNFRPVGHFFFFAAGRLFGLSFPKYVAALQLLHLVNVWLLWMLARRMGAPPFAALAACIFFGLHMALFDAFWKPMYVFDVLCGTFSLLALLFWAQRRWLLSFAAFWLAYKSKEVAVMLPAVLFCYEYWLGKRQWKPLIPFFAASFSFGLQGLLLNPNRDNNYTFRFTFAALRQTSVYYAGRVFLLPYLGFLAPVAAFTTKNRRTWFGLAMAAILFFPMLFLPGRLFSPYCYAPFTGLALAFSGVAEAVGPIPTSIFLLLFMPLNFHEMRVRRNDTLALASKVRGWVAPVSELARTSPSLDGVVYGGEIPGFAPWGMEGAIHLLLRQDLKVVSADDPAAQAVLQLPRIAYIAWNPGVNRSIISLHEPGTPDVAWLDFNQSTPIWQLEEGWFGLEGGFRWTAPVATARLTRPAGVQRFTLRVLVGPARLRAAGPVTLRVSLNDRVLEPRTFNSPGWQDATWDLPPQDAGPVQMRIQCDPPFRPSAEPRTLGIAVGAFGFR